MLYAMRVQKKTKHLPIEGLQGTIIIYSVHSAQIQIFFPMKEAIVTTPYSDNSILSLFFLISIATSIPLFFRGKSLQYKNCGKITRQRSMLLSKLVKWVPLGLQRPNIYQLFTLNLMKPCLKFAPEATFKQMYSTCSSFKQSFQVVRQRYGELQLDSVLHLIFRLHTQITKFGKNVMD